MAQAEPATATMPTDDAAVAVLTELLADSSAASVLDLGGGTGVYAVPLALRGHRVTVLDQSPDALATLGRRAQAAGVDDLVRGEVADLDALDSAIGDRADDLVLCHRVLEYVDDPQATLRSAASALAPHGRLSLITTNRDGAVLARIVSGRLDDAVRIATGADSGSARGGCQFDLTELTDLATGLGLRVDAAYGLGLVAELSPPDASTADVRALCQATAGRPALRNVAPLVHLILAPAD